MIVARVRLIRLGSHSLAHLVAFEKILVRETGLESAMRTLSPASYRLVVQLQAGRIWRVPRVYAAWYFNFHQERELTSMDTTGFSRVVFQFQPTKRGN